MAEIKARFGTGSELRAVQFQSIEWLIPLCTEAGITRIVLNGSFVTDRPEPNDVDCLLLQGPRYRADAPAALELEKGLAYLEIKIVNDEEFAFFVETVFGTDRTMIRKGMIEVVL